jgi:hypothetical protein
LGAIYIERGRDHGEPAYNQLRQAYGLAPKTSFTAITGEATEAGPGRALQGVGFIASWDNATNPMPVNITLDNRRCALE